MQVVLLNVYDRRHGYYKFWHIEAFIRKLARENPNSFHYANFLCCREVLENKHGCFAGPKDEALAKYQEQKAALNDAKN